MNKYDIKQLAERPKGTVVRLQPIEERLSSVKQYNVILNKLLRELAKETRESVIPAFKADKQFRQDSESWFTRLKAKAEELRRVATNMTNDIFRLEAKRHNKSFMQAAKRSLGIDLSAVIREEDLDSILSDYADRNASLIKSLSDDVVKRVEQAVYSAKISGKSATQLSKDLQKQFGIASKRADLIAQDQLSKLNSDLNRTRQEQAGIQEYVWSTSKDERVRVRHKKLEGTVYKWGQQTKAEEGLPPGQPIRCRCIAVAQVTF